MYEVRKYRRLRIRLKKEGFPPAKEHVTTYRHFEIGEHVHCYGALNGRENKRHKKTCKGH